MRKRDITKLATIVSNPVRLAIFCNVLDHYLKLNDDELYETVGEYLKERRGWDISKPVYDWNVKQLVEADVIGTQKEMYYVSKLPSSLIDCVKEIRKTGEEEHEVLAVH